ncbi:hypothetical protein [Streptomyces sp. NPDC059003]|uniref:hypothetical protein n=1 Tax=Streptomyces sp. NPDC059003 TaxID=3346691 RepID=UPI00367855BF
MSEDIASGIYLLVAGIGLCTTAAKVWAWRRERSSALLLIAVSSTVGAGAFLLASPVVYRSIAALTGSQNLSELLVFFCILGFFVLTHVMSLLWHRHGERRSARSILLRPLVIYAIAAAGMVTGFLVAGLEDAPHPLDFNATYGQDPGALVMLGSFQSALAYAHRCPRQSDFAAAPCPR